MKKRKLLLDVGCGEAKCCIDFAKEEYDVIGVEKNSEIFERAKKNVEKSGAQKFITLHNCDIRKIDLEQKFDAVIFNYVLMFMPKKDALGLIGQFYQNLNKKGEMLIRMLMFDDPIAITLRDKKIKDIFFLSYEEMEELGKQYQGVPEFDLKREDAHGDQKYSHIHSTGFLKIGKV